MKTRRAARRGPVWKVVLAVLAGGALTWWVSALLISPALRAGVPATIAMKLPIVGFLLGMLLGLAVMYSASVKLLGSIVLASVLCGGMCWLLGLGIGGLLFAAGISDTVADRVATAAFWLGAALGILPGVAIGADRWTRWTARLGPGRTR